MGTGTEVKAAGAGAGAIAQGNQTDVYAVFGAEPEVLAYAMAKYSRSALSMKESLREISSQRAEEFLNTFYFQYGHRSIADLAHVAFAIERLSLLAAVQLVDEQRWDGQERSTRYQNFRRSGWYTPEMGERTGEYTEAIEALFAGYDAVNAGMLEALKRAVPRPSEMDEGQYTRTLKARAFDIARYLLPLATNTSLGQIVNARTLETQVSRLLTSEYAEVRELGAKLRGAASGAAWDLKADECRILVDEIAAVNAEAGERARAVLLREVKVSPTLVKYAAVNEYKQKTDAELKQVAEELLRGVEIARAPVVDLVEGFSSGKAGSQGALEVEIAASLIYAQCHHPYRQVREVVGALPAGRRDEIVRMGAKHRGRHDELLRAWSAGQGLAFDILMDIGGFRDMHRHRKCTQLMQGYTTVHGFELPDAPGQPSLAESGLLVKYTAAMEEAHGASQRLAAVDAASAHYLLPLGTRCRSLFKMDFAEAVYISELRSTVAGHYSYRRVAWEMYLAVQRAHPALAEFFRISDVNEPVDLLKR